MGDDFGVRARGEAVAERAQLVPQRPEVVDLSVERGLHGTVLVRHGLITRLEIDTRRRATPRPSRPST